MAVHGANHFAQQSSLVHLNKRRLATLLDNYHKMTRLRSQAVSESGIFRGITERTVEHEFYPLYLHCVGYANRVKSPYLIKCSKMSLSRLIGRYLFLGDQTVLKRVPKSILLMVIVWFPTKLADKCMRLRELWR